MATIGQLIEGNIGLIVTSAIAGLLAYAVGTTQATATIRELTSRVAVLERQAEAGRAYHNCANRHFDAIRRGDTAPPPCQLGSE